MFCDLLLYISCVIKIHIIVIIFHFGTVAHGNPWERNGSLQSYNN